MHIVICCGGTLGDWSLPILTNADYRIGADSGAAYMASNNFFVDFAIGDFDSCDEAELQKIRSSASKIQIVDAIDKDDTDSGLALKYALKLKPQKITIIGATGTRFDHTLNNIQLLHAAAEQGVYCEIVDANNRMQLITPKHETIIQKSDYSYVSFLPLSEKVTGINLVGFNYPLNNATFIQGSAIGVSNKISGEQGVVSIKTGRLLCIQSGD